MTQPLALVLYDKLLPGSQLVNKLQDMNYRVQTVAEPSLLVESAEQTKPLLVIADLESGRNEILAELGRLRQNSGTKHLPIIGFSRDDSEALKKAAQDSGVTLFVTDAAIVNHLPQLLNQALEVE